MNPLTARHFGKQLFMILCAFARCQMPSNWSGLECRITQNHRNENSIQKFANYCLSVENFEKFFIIVNFLLFGALWSWKKAIIWRFGWECIKNLLKRFLKCLKIVTKIRINFITSKIIYKKKWNKRSMKKNLCGVYRKKGGRKRENSHIVVWNSRPFYKIRNITPSAIPKKSSQISNFRFWNICCVCKHKKAFHYNKLVNKYHLKNVYFIRVTQICIFFRKFTGGKSFI